MALRNKSGARDVVTLADLSPRHDVKGGSQRVFGESTFNERRDAMKPKVIKDLPPKSPTKVKGGTRVFPQDNITLVRGAKPSKKRDLPPRKTVKGGGKKMP